MSSESQSPVITVSNVEKIFRMYRRPQDRLKQMVLPRLKIGRKNAEYFEKFSALKGVSLTLGRGETVGIVGRNGSGKSTLLQIICGTLQPTAGQVTVNGRVAALLELGAGFNPEFTGRENVYLNGAIIGLTREEIDDRFEKIARFADIGQFMDQPAKSYSSGMYVRLAFSVAIHADPDVLIVDEALSVGDESFQRKCFARIEDMQSRGTTILFVSHSAQAVIELCDRAVLLDAGEIILTGQPKKVVGQYQRLMNLTGGQAQTARASIQRMNAQADTPSMNVENDKQAPHQLEKNFEVGETTDPIDPSWYDSGLVSSSSISYETQGAKISDPGIYNAAGKAVNNIAVGRRYSLRYTIEFEVDAQKLVYGYYFKTVSGVELAGANNLRVNNPLLREAKSGDTLDVDFAFNCHLMSGTYFLTVGLMAMVDGEYKFLHRIADVLAIHVMQGTNSAPFDYGFVALGTELTVVNQTPAS